MVENSGKKGGRQGMDGLSVVNKTNAWKTVRSGSVERRRWRKVCPFLERSSAEIGGWTKECREDGVCEKCVEGK